MDMTMVRRVAAVLFICFCFMAGTLSAVEKSDDVNTGKDITKPLAHFDIQEIYQNLTTGKDAYNTVLNFRIDKSITLNKEGWKLSARLALPVVASGDNAFLQNKSGISDLLNQFVLTAPQGTKNWTFAVGTQNIFPTASENGMGSGRYLILPFIGAKIELKEISNGSFVMVVLGNCFDAGGDDSMDKINYFGVLPVVNIALPHNTFVTLAPEIRVNWESRNSTSMPFDISFGKVINKTVIVSIDYKTPILDRPSLQFNHTVGISVGLLL